MPLPVRDLRRLSTTGIPADNGLRALSSQFLLQLARRMPELSPSDTARLSALALGFTLSSEPISVTTA